MMRVSVLNFGFSFLACALLVGCGSESGGVDRPDRVPVTGRVTYNGNPVEGATVAFHPPGSGDPGTPTEGRGAIGQTDADGRFQLTTFEPNDGAIPGQYRVSIKKLKPVEQPEVFDEDDPRYDPDVGTEEAPAPEHLLPEKYANPQSSQLSATVNAEGENDFPFELTD